MPLLRQGCTSGLRILRRGGGEGPRNHDCGGTLTLDCRHIPYWEDRAPGRSCLDAIIDFARRPSSLLRSDFRRRERRVRSRRRPRPLQGPREGPGYRARDRERAADPGQPPQTLYSWRCSPSARRCPQCGEPQPHATNRQKMIGVGVVIAVMIAMSAFAAHGSAERDREVRDFRRQHGFPASAEE